MAISLVWFYFRSQARRCSLLPTILVAFLMPCFRWPFAFDALLGFYRSSAGITWIAFNAIFLSGVSFVHRFRSLEISSIDFLQAAPVGTICLTTEFWNYSPVCHRALKIGGRLYTYWYRYRFSFSTVNVKSFESISLKLFTAKTWILRNRWTENQANLLKLLEIGKENTTFVLILTWEYCSLSTVTYTDHKEKQQDLLTNVHQFLPVVLHLLQWMRLIWFAQFLTCEYMNHWLALQKVNRCSQSTGQLFL